MKEPVPGNVPTTRSRTAVARTKKTNKSPKEFVSSAAHEKFINKIFGSADTFNGLPISYIMTSDDKIPEEERQAVDAVVRILSKMVY